MHDRTTPAGRPAARGRLLPGGEKIGLGQLSVLHRLGLAPMPRPHLGTSSVLGQTVTGGKYGVGAIRQEAGGAAYQKAAGLFDFAYGLAYDYVPGVKPTHDFVREKYDGGSQVWDDAGTSYERGVVKGKAERITSRAQDGQRTMESADAENDVLRHKYPQYFEDSASGRGAVTGIYGTDSEELSPGMTRPTAGRWVAGSGSRGAAPPPRPERALSPLLTADPVPPPHVAPETPAPPPAGATASGQASIFDYALPIAAGAGGLYGLYHWLNSDDEEDDRPEAGYGPPVEDYYVPSPGGYGGY